MAAWRERGEGSRVRGRRAGEAVVMKEKGREGKGIVVVAGSTNLHFPPPSLHALPAAPPLDPATCQCYVCLGPGGADEASPGYCV